MKASILVLSGMAFLGHSDPCFAARRKESFQLKCKPASPQEIKEVIFTIPVMNPLEVTASISYTPKSKKDPVELSLIFDELFTAPNLTDDISFRESGYRAFETEEGADLHFRAQIEVPNWGNWKPRAVGFANHGSGFFMPCMDIGLAD